MGVRGAHLCREGKREAWRGALERQTMNCIGCEHLITYTEHDASGSYLAPDGCELEMEPGSCRQCSYCGEFFDTENHECEGETK